MSSTYKNHYVCCFYLEHFTSEGQVSVYKTLVPHQQVPLWKTYSPRAIAYFEHLYTSVKTGKESDEIEQWLGREIDFPASRVIDKVIAGAKISPSDWRILIRFVAAQDVRTPANFSRSLQAWNDLIPETLNRSLDDLKAKLQTANSAKGNITENDATTFPHQEHIPIRLDVRTSGDSAFMRAEMLAGRSLFLFDLKRLITSTWEILAKHRWKVLKAPPGVSWLTSDDPVIKLNLYRNRYNLGGGWNSQGTRIMLPLSPEHLLYTQVGVRRPAQDHVVTIEEALLFNRITAEHASRAIYSHRPIDNIASIRNRVVNILAVEQEKAAKRSFHDKQTTAEWEMLTRPIRDQAER